MKHLIMCEGPNELEIIRILLEHNALCFCIDDLLNLVPYHARQIHSNRAVQTALQLYPGTIEVHRVGDVLSDNLKIPKEYKFKIHAVTKYCTKPELEMLLILSENLEFEFEKVKSQKSPKEFCKEHIIYNRTRYNNSTSFYRLFFENRISLLIQTIEKYKRYKGSHKKDEHYLADLLKH